MAFDAPSTNDYLSSLFDDLSSADGFVFGKARAPAGKDEKASETTYGLTGTISSNGSGETGGGGTVSFDQQEVHAGDTTVTLRNQTETAADWSERSWSSVNVVDNTDGSFSGTQTTTTTDSDGKTTGTTTTSWDVDEKGNRTERTVEMDAKGNVTSDTTRTYDADGNQTSEVDNKPEDDGGVWISPDDLFGKDVSVLADTDFTSQDDVDALIGYFEDGSFDFM